MSDNNWRQQPFVRAVVYSCCWLLLQTSSAPLFAAPPIVLPNTLPRQGGGTWFGADTPKTTGNTMTIDQTKSQAILNWESFNIGKDAKVQFNQPSVDSSALNIINDSSASHIFGQLNANGNVYLINNNGILFHEGAQVNVHGLVASTLNINTSNSSLLTAIDSGKAALAGGTVADASIIVEAGATIKTTGSNGQVLMFAPNVINNGEISTPDGQTILAASQDKVYLTASDKDQDLRGVLVEVATGGTVTNVGKIVAERGNITLLGLAVNQNGRVTATTSVDVNGSIRLLARDRAKIEETGQVKNLAGEQKSLLLDDVSEIPGGAKVAVATHAGTVSFSANSVTEVVADELTAKQRADGVKEKTAADAQPQNRSRIDAMANTITVGDGAVIRAKSGKINLIATTTPDDPESAAARTASKIHIGSNAVLDVSGENVALPIERRVVAVELRGDELKDAPLQRNGVLRGKTVSIDLATGSPLISDLKPTFAKIQKGVKERMVTGGTINLQSQGDVVLNDNTTLNTAGGSISYASGLVNTTKLLSANGNIVDIGNADPNQTYIAVFGKHTESHPKWGKKVYGESSIFSTGKFREGSTNGQDAGALNITTQLLQGFDLANVQAGVQRSAEQRALLNGPVAGTVNIALGQGTAATVQNSIIDQVAHSTVSALLDPLSSLLGDAPVAYFSADKLNASGVGLFLLKTNGHIEVTKATDLHLNAGSKFALSGTKVDFNGKLTIPSGAVALATTAAVGREGDDNVQPLTLGALATIDVSGAWSNDALDLRNRAQPGVLTLNGGSIDLGARGDLTLTQGAHLSANGGGQIKANGDFQGGNGGSIKLATKAQSANDVGSHLQLDGSYSAYGFAQGGKLTLEANGFQIGRSAANDSRVVQLDPAFFTRGGFSDYSLKSNLIGIDIAPQTKIAPQQKNYGVSDLAQLKKISSGGDIGASLKVITLSDYDRNPVNLHLNALQTVARANVIGPAYLRMGNGAAILADSGATLDLISVGSVAIDGQLQARGGQINIGVQEPTSSLSVDRGYLADQSLWLGSHALLDAAATIERAIDSSAALIDKVFDAGAIKLTAERGFIVAAPGSKIDVSGARYQVALPRSSSVKAQQSSATVDAAAGSISFGAADGIAVYASLNGHGVGEGRDGSIAFALDGNTRKEGSDSFPFYPLEISVAETLPIWNDALQNGTGLPAALRGKALVSAENVRSGGFGSLNLSAANKLTQNGHSLSKFGRILFDSDVKLSLSDALTLNSTNIDVANHAVDLKAAVLTLGPATETTPMLIAQLKDETKSGTGTLALSAKFIDVVGNVGISGAADTQLNSNTDLRFRSVIDAANLRQLAAGELTTQGNLLLRAAQIYPSTLSNYTVRVSGANSVLSTAQPIGGGTRTPILSAGGYLTLRAPNIDHAGVVVAPLGTVELDATHNIHLEAGSNIDVSSNELIPFGRLLGSDLYWTYPIQNGQPLLIDSVPQKNVLLNANSTKMEIGASVNLSGGGDIYAFEQIAGPGGSRDFLDVANAKGAFAVLPKLGNLTTPYDTVEMNGQSIALGTTVWLDGSNGLLAGNYAVLPAHYALLPGAYLITPKGNAIAGIAEHGTLIDGTPLISGRFGRGFSEQYNSQSQLFSIETGAAARQRSEYKESTGADFFKGSAADLAKDAGPLTITAQRVLELNGTINAASQNGRGAQLDIIADNIAVVADYAQQVGAGVVKLAASALNNLGVDSLLLGGSRTRAGDDTKIAVRSASVTIGAGADLHAPDVILAARNRIDVQANARVAGIGKSQVNTRAFIIDGDGALLRASSAQQSNVQRTNSNGSSGDLIFASSATLAADSSLLLDATHAMLLPSTLELENGSLNLSANRISLGDAPADTTGVALSNAQLNALHASELRISSRSSIDFYNSVNFQSNTTTLNTGALRSMLPGAVSIVASDTLQLENGVNTLPLNGSASNGGQLLLAAKKIVLGRVGDAVSTLSLDGFDRVQLGASGQTTAVLGSGSFSLRGTAFNIFTDRIGAADAGATTHLLATDVVTLNRAGAAVANSADPTVLGASLTIEAKSISDDTRIELPSGIATLTANGSATTDNVTLQRNAVIDVSGRSITLPHAAINTAGGIVNLTSQHGDVLADSRAALHIDGAADGGDAGTLNIAAVNGSADWLGALTATAANNARGGSLSIDARVLPNADAWLALAGSAGATNNLTLRARSGDVIVNGDARAQHISISADSGSLTLGGDLTRAAVKLDASGASGGSVALYAGNDLNLQSNAKITAIATADNGRGGTVELGSGISHGTLRFAAGSAIDVAGGNGGRNGNVNLRAARNANNDDVAVVNNGVAINGAERVQLAAVKTYQRNVLNDALLTTMQTDAVVFFGNTVHEAQIKSQLGTLASANNFHLVPEFEVVSSGDMTIANAVNFAADKNFDGVMDGTGRFGANNEAPILTLRSAGNLIVAQSIGDGIFTYDLDALVQNGYDPLTNAPLYLKSITYLTDENGHKQPGFLGQLSYLLAGDSASYRLVAGADLAAANPDATNSAGNLVLSNGADIVTGTGSIKLAAGGNIVVNNANSLIASVGNTTYSTYDSPFAEDGLPATELMPDTGTFNAVWAFLTSFRAMQYPKNGGDVSIAAKGNIDFATATDFFSNWIGRLGGEFNVVSGASAAGQADRTFNLTTWGVMLEHLQQGVVALGGGNVDVGAGGNIKNLNVALPSTAKQVGVGKDENVLEIIRGGNLSVVAGGDILSPRLLVDNGAATLSAGGNIGAVTGGLQTLAVLGDAALTLSARGDVGIDAVINTTAMPQSINQLLDSTSSLTTTNYFFTYGDAAAVHLQSLNGNIAFSDNNAAVLGALKDNFAIRQLDGRFGSAANENNIFKIYPGRISAEAATGNIDIRNEVILFPSSHGQLTLLAAGDISGLPFNEASNAIVRQSDTDPTALPSWMKPAASLDSNNSIDTVIKRLSGNSAFTSNTLLHASIPLHANDNEASIIDALGDIKSDDKFVFTFQLSEQTQIAARDIIGTNFNIQNNRASDVSEIITQRDFISPVSFSASGTLQGSGGAVTIAGPGSLDIMAGRNINLGASEGFVSIGNQNNPRLPDSGATLNVLAGINGATALTDPVLLHGFLDTYLAHSGGPLGSYIDWFQQGAYTGDLNNLLGAFTGKQYADRAAALADFHALPALTQQAISLEAYRTQRTALLDHASSSAAYGALNGFADANDYSTELINFVSFERFGGDLRAAVSAVTGAAYVDNRAAASALALLSAAQQHRIAQAALAAAPVRAQREMVMQTFFNEIRQGGVENAKNLIADKNRDSFNRSYAAIEKIFPGKKWQGDINLVFSGIRTIDGGDINFLAPGGKVNVGLAGQFAGFKKDSGKLGIIAQRYGEINGFADSDININQSRIFSLDGGGITLWSTHGNIDAGRGAKSALTIPPPTVTVNPDDGSISLVFPAAVAGSGIQGARNNRATAVDRGPLLADSTVFNVDGRSDRQRYFRSLAPGDTFLFAPSGVIDAGDAGIAVQGNLLLAAQSVLGTDNISVGGVSVGVPTSTSVSAGTLSLGDAASSATEAATGSMNDAIKEAAAAISEGNVAFVTVDILGVGK